MPRGLLSQVRHHLGELPLWAIEYMSMLPRGYMYDSLVLMPQVFLQGLIGGDQDISLWADVGASARNSNTFGQAADANCSVPRSLTTPRPERWKMDLPELKIEAHRQSNFTCNIWEKDGCADFDGM